MRPFYDDGRVTIFHGDALAILPELPDHAVDLLIADPPYSSGGMFRGDRAQDVHSKYVKTESHRGQGLAAFSGDTRDQRGHWYWMSLWLAASLGVVRPGGIAALFTDWRQLPTTTDALQAGGYVWRGIVPWHKPGARPTQGRWANASEYVAWGTNGPRLLAGRALPGFFSYVAPREREHIAQKPVELLVDLLRLVPEGGVVLDPFMGSGTTLEAAKRTGRRAIGIDFDEHWCESAARRLAQVAEPTTEGV